MSARRLMGFLVAINKGVLAAREKQRQIDIQARRQAVLDQQIAINEHKLAQAANAVVLSDMKIEKKRMELEALERAESMRTEFKPIDPP